MTPNGPGGASAAGPRRHPPALSRRSPLLTRTRCRKVRRHHEHRASASATLRVQDARRRPRWPGQGHDRRRAARRSRAATSTSSTFRPRSGRPLPDFASSGGGRESRRTWSGRRSGRIRRRRRFTMRCAYLRTRRNRSSSPTTRSASSRSVGRLRRRGGPRAPDREGHPARRLDVDEQRLPAGAEGRRRRTRRRSDRRP